MPTYEYACTECGDRLEVVQRFSDDPLTLCAACGGRLRKVFSPVGIVFKGSGFYRTDSRSGAVGAGGNGKGHDSSAGSDGGSGDKAEAGAKADAGAKAETGKAGSDGGSGASKSDGASGNGSSGGSKSGTGSAGAGSSKTGSKVA